MFRKMLLTLSIAFGLVATTGMPASATPDRNQCATYRRPTTVLQICPDVDGDRRGTYIEACAMLLPEAVGGERECGFGVGQQVRLTIHYATAYQCNNGGDPNLCSPIGSASNVHVTGYVLVSWSGAYGNLAPGHTYRACANVSVNDEWYGTVCSGTRAN